MTGPESTLETERSPALPSWTARFDPADVETWWRTGPTQVPEIFGTPGYPSRRRIRDSCADLRAGGGGGQLAESVNQRVRVAARRGSCISIQPSTSKPPPPTARKIQSYMGR